MNYNVQLYVTQHKRIYINVGKKSKEQIKNKMCNKIKCAGQHTVDLIKNNIGRDVQEECANRLYRAEGDRGVDFQTSPVPLPQKNLVPIP